MKKNIVGKIIAVLAIVCMTVEVGITLGYYMLVNIDFNKYDTVYKVEVLKD